MNRMPTKPLIVTIALVFSALLSPKRRRPQRPLLPPPRQYRLQPHPPS